MKYGILVPSYLKFFPYNLEIMNPFFIYLSILCTLPFFQQSSDYVTRTFISFISGLNLFFLKQHTHIPLNQFPHKTIPHLPLLQPHQVSVLSEKTLAKVLPHLSPSFPGPSFSDFPPGPPVPARPPSIHPANFRLRIFHKMFRNVPSPNVSTKVSNVPHTSFFVSLLMLSTGFTSMHSPRYDITVTHKD